MKAAFINEHGDVDRIHVEDVKEPGIKNSEVILDVRSAALNHLDIWVRRGGRLKLELPHILGSDAAGIVIDKGTAVKNIKLGDEVILNPGFSAESCEWTKRGKENLSPTFGIIGMHRSGTFAERIAVPGKNLFPKPPHLSFDEAAALPLVFLTAWHMLVTRAAIQANETVLIHGIGGGVALAGLQLAKLMKARVIVTSSSDSKLSRAEEMGADATLNYTVDLHIADTILDITKGRGVDIVLDTVGANTWPINLQAARRGGRIVHCGITSGHEVQANLQTIYWQQLSILGATMGTMKDFQDMLHFVTQHQLRPVVDSIQPLDRTREATERLEHSEQFGKIVLKIS